MAITKEGFISRLRSAVKEYIADEEAYDDNAQLCVKPATMEVFLEDSREVDVDSPDIDCYDVMDFVEMSSNPEYAGRWIVDESAVESVADEYFE